MLRPFHKSGDGRGDRDGSSVGSGSGGGHGGGGDGGSVCVGGERGSSRGGEHEASLSSHKREALLASAHAQPTSPVDAGVGAGSSSGGTSIVNGEQLEERSCDPGDRAPPPPPPPSSSSDVIGDHRRQNSEDSQSSSSSGGKRKRRTSARDHCRSVDDATLTASLDCLSLEGKLNVASVGARLRSIRSATGSVRTSPVANTSGAAVANRGGGGGGGGGGECDTTSDRTVGPVGLRTVSNGSHRRTQTLPPGSSLIGGSLLSCRGKLSDDDGGHGRGISSGHTVRPTLALSLSPVFMCIYPRVFVCIYPRVFVCVCICATHPSS